jgi:mannitol-specific phosphotransferase system IIBC component
MTVAPPNPRVVRRIAFGYALDFFPGTLILGFNQLKHMLERAGFAATVSMSPLSDLPLDADIILVPRVLLEGARKVAPNSRVEGLDSFLDHPIYRSLIEELESGQEWTAARLTQHPSEEGEGQVVRYRGYQRIDAEE